MKLISCNDKHDQNSVSSTAKTNTTLPQPSSGKSKIYVHLDCVTPVILNGDIEIFKLFDVDSRTEFARSRSVKSVFLLVVVEALRFGNEKLLIVSKINGLVVIVAKFKNEFDSFILFGKNKRREQCAAVGWGNRLEFQLIMLYNIECFGNIILYYIIWWWKFINSQKRKIKLINKQGSFVYRNIIFCACKLIFIMLYIKNNLYI